jgi:hypothetical protein
MIRTILESIRHTRLVRDLPTQAEREWRRDSQSLPERDHGIEKTTAAASEWICTAQDRSASADGGVARDYSLINGWNSSYPETTGYIVPTMIEYAQLTNNSELLERAERMLDFLCSVQFPEGGFPGSVIGATPSVPVTFNTGQILLGLAAGVRAFGDRYAGPMRRAADWLAETQDPDGCWRKHPSPFADAMDKVYDTHVAWGLLEADRAEPGRGYGDAALRNIEWALTQQEDNGWFNSCCLSDSERPLTHTLGYALRGVIEGYRYSGDPRLLDASRRTADGLLTAVREDGALPGRLNDNWEAAVEWTCLTGNVQISACWLLLYDITNDPAYLNAARAINAFVRRTVRLYGPAETRGAIKGSFPISGGYCTYEYPNWAAKFFVDANLLELGAAGAVI